MFLKMGTKTRTLPCLLDTGCDRCIMPRKYVRRQKLAQAEKSVLAANGSEIVILGSATLKFNLGGQELSADFLVTDGIDKIILGFSFLRRYKCHWLFDEAVLVVSVLLKSAGPSECAPHIRATFCVCASWQQRERASKIHHHHHHRQPWAQCPLVTDAILTIAAHRCLSRAAWLNSCKVVPHHCSMSSDHSR